MPLPFGKVSKVRPDPMAAGEVWDCRSLADVHWNAEGKSAKGWRGIRLTTD